MEFHHKKILYECFSDFGKVGRVLFRHFRHEYNRGRGGGRSGSTKKAKFQFALYLKELLQFVPGKLDVELFAEVLALVKVQVAALVGVRLTELVLQVPVANEKVVNPR